eukprot:5377848-Amphidinium_carterae.1
MHHVEGLAAPLLGSSELEAVLAVRSLAHLGALCMYSTGELPTQARTMLHHGIQRRFHTTSPVKSTAGPKFAST